MNYKLPIYTLTNWRLIAYLWPNGTAIGDSYTVYLDVDSKAYRDKLARLRRLSPYLAGVIVCHGESTNGIIFTKGF